MSNRLTEYHNGVAVIKGKRFKEAAEKLAKYEDGEEKYKLALFAAVRNSQVMPLGIELGKSEQEINQMSVETVDAILTMCDFDRLKEMWIEGGGSDE